MEQIFDLPPALRGHDPSPPGAAPVDSASCISGIFPYSVTDAMPNITSAAPTSIPAKAPVYTFSAQGFITGQRSSAQTISHNLKARRKLREMHECYIVKMFKHNINNNLTKFFVTPSESVLIISRGTGLRSQTVNQTYLKQFVGGCFP